MKVKLTLEQYEAVKHLFWPCKGHGYFSVSNSYWGRILIKLSEKNVVWVIGSRNKIISYPEYKIQIALGTLQSYPTIEFVLNPKIKTVPLLSKPPYAVVIDD